MLFGKRNQLVGLDIGTSSIKIAEIVDSPKGYIAKKILIEKLPYDLFEDGEPKDPGHLSTILKDIFQKKRLSNKNVAMSIGGYSAIVKPITIPIKEDSDIQSLILEEAEHYIPFDISEVNIDYQVMGEHEENPNMLSVLLVAAKRDVINKYVGIANNAGLSPVVMDIDAFAVQNIFELNEPEVESGVLINVGANKISLNIVNNRKSVFMREVAMGSYKINKEIMAFNPELKFIDAEQIKFGEKNEGIDEISLNQLMHSVVNEWCREISRAIDFFYSNNSAGSLGKVYVCGGGAHIEKFREELGNYVNTEINMLDPFQVIHTDKLGYSEEDLQKMGPELCVALGLGLRKMDDK